jgi:hypothetical protein
MDLNAPEAKRTIIEAKINVMSRQEKKRSFLSWQLSFPKSNRWDDPVVIDALRKEAILVTMRTLKGIPTPKEQTQAALFVLGRMVATHTSPQVTVNLTAKDFLEAKRRAGLLPGPAKLLGSET